MLKVIFLIRYWFARKTDLELNMETTTDPYAGFCKRAAPLRVLGAIDCTNIMIQDIGYMNGGFSTTVSGAAPSMFKRGVMKNQK